MLARRAKTRSPTHCVTGAYRSPRPRGLAQEHLRGPATTVHSETQGQSTPVFALALLLGIKLILTPNTPEHFDRELALAFAATTHEGVENQSTA